MSCIIKIDTSRKKLYKRVYTRDSVSVEESPDVSAAEMCEYILGLIEKNRKECANNEQKKEFKCI